MSRLCTWKACCGSSVSGVHAPPVFWVGPPRLSLAEMQWKKETHFKRNAGLPLSVTAANSKPQIVWNYEPHLQFFLEHYSNDIE